MQEEEPNQEVAEAFNLGSGLRVEHYEIAGYRSAIALAKQTGNIEAAQYLNQNLEQEIAMARFIEANGLEHNLVGTPKPVVDAVVR